MSELLKLKEYVVRLVLNIDEATEKYTQVMAQDTIALVTDRLVNDGVGADGIKFPLYSENKLKDKTSKKTISKSNRPNAKPKGASSYKEIRQLLGLPVDKRTHSFSGAMLRSVGYDVIKGQNVTTIVIQSKNKEYQKILNVNSGRMKINLLALTDDEADIVVESYNEMIKYAIK